MQEICGEDELDRFMAVFTGPWFISKALMGENDEP